MIIHTHGDPNSPAIVLLHPMLLSGRIMYEMLGQKIPGSYFIISPDQAGHGEDRDEAFSPSRDAAELRQYLLSRGITRVELLYAASMGGLTAMQLLKLGGIRFRAVHLDGIPLADSGPVRRITASLRMLVFWKKARKDPDAAARLVPYEFGRRMVDQLAGLPRRNVWRIGTLCASGCAVPLEERICGRMTFEWGEKEINLAEGKPLAEKLYPRARIIVREGLGHCSYMSQDPEAFALELANEIGSVPD